MRLAVFTCLMLLLAACYGLPAHDVAPGAPVSGAAPATFEDAEKAATRAAHAAKPPSEDPSCAEAAKRFAAADPAGRWQERLALARAADPGARPALGPAETRAFPRPAWPEGAASRNVSCLIIFDLGAAGAPASVDAACSDPAFEASAIAAMADARFRLTGEDGQPIALAGHLYPIDFCTDD